MITFISVGLSFQGIVIEVKEKGSSRILIYLVFCCSEKWCGIMFGCSMLVDDQSVCFYKGTHLVLLI
jgi:hypothetical protein